MTQKTAFIRIGSDKAGTVTIAQFVQMNRSRLAKADVIAPNRNCLGFVDHLVKANQLTELAFFDPTRNFARNPAELVRLQEFIRDYDTYKDRDVLLTTETIWGKLSKRHIDQPTTRRQIEQLFEAMCSFFRHHRVKIILHLRRADDYIDSLYNQRIKAGGAETVEKFLAKPNYRGLAERSLLLLDLLETGFGRENIVIRPFERSQMVGGDLIADLLHLIQRPHFKFDQNKAPSNESLHRALVEVLRGINAEKGKILSNRGLQAISSFIRLEMDVPDRKGALTSAQRLKLLDEFMPFYREISSRYRDGVELFESFVPGPDAAFSLSESDADVIRSLVTNSVDRKKFRKKSFAASLRAIVNAKTVADLTSGVVPETAVEPPAIMEVTPIKEPAPVAETKSGTELETVAAPKTA